MWFTRAVSATVVKGKVVTRAKLDAEDEAEISRGIAEIKSGKFVGADRARAFLRRK